MAGFYLNLPEETRWILTPTQRHPSDYESGIFDLNNYAMLYVNSSSQGGLTMHRLFVTTVPDCPTRGTILGREELVPKPELIEAPRVKSPARAVESTVAEWRARPVETPSARVVADGKFFRLGSQKFYPRGVTYGPFKPDETGSTFPQPVQVERDFELLKRLNANCLRVYHVPPRWFLDLAQQHGLKVLVDYYWPKHTCFLDDVDTVEFARRATRQAAEALAGHPAVFALTLANEIPPDIARWYGAKRIAQFIDELAGIVKKIDPQRLVTFVNFPTTEFLQPTSIDFVSFNVYLHEPRPFANYLDRLQSIAGDKPLLLAEFGIDSKREGEEIKAQILSGHIEIAFRAGLAGIFLFAFTDDWHTGGHQIENWFFGLTTRDRKPRASFHVVAEQFRRAPYFPLPQYPKVSVVVASYNGARTLPACLDSLTHLNYPDYEIILVDDGSTDDTARVTAHYPMVRTIHQPNLGLSAARNTGTQAATGEIIAFTDSDCHVDEDWLYYIVGDLLKTDACAIGGHNFPPPGESLVSGCVAVSPGGPAHVMLDDRNAEHIPGCNMAFWKWALDEIHGFDAQFRAAGDDVDVCWRLLQRGRKIAFSHSGFVWHNRRHTIAAYLKQQRGYGIAETLLRRKHPEYFNSLGGMRWRGRIYSPSKIAGFFGKFVIYHGTFGSALFQTLYTPEPGGVLALLTSLEWHVLFTVGGILLAIVWPALWPLPALTFLASLAVTMTAAARVELPPWQKRWWSRPLVAILYLLQPVVRGWPRYARQLHLSETPPAARETVRALAAQYEKLGSRHTLNYWNEKGIERFAFLEALLELLDRDRWQSRTDSGWDEFDVTIFGDRFSRVLVQTVSENHGGEKRLLRARLKAGWTLRGKISFFVMALVMCMAARLWWSIMLPVTRVPVWALWTGTLVPVLLMALWTGYLCLRAQRSLRLATALLDLCAKQIGLIKLTAPRRFERPA